MGKKKKLFLYKKLLTLGIVTSLAFSIIGCSNTTKYQSQKINDNIGFTKDISNDNLFDYTSLSSDNDTTKTFGKVGEYAISINLVDSYAQAIEKYGSLEKAQKELKVDTTEDLDGTLFSLCLSSYVGGLSKNVGIPTKEEVLNLSNGSWVHYYNLPTMANGDNMEVFLTWNNGCFYYIEVAYVNELNIPIEDVVANIKFNNGNATLPDVLK